MKQSTYLSDKQEHKTHIPARFWDHNNDKNEANLPDHNTTQGPW